MNQLASLHNAWTCSISSCIRTLGLICIRIQGAVVALILLFDKLVVLPCRALGRRLLGCERVLRLKATGVVPALDVLSEAAPVDLLAAKRIDLWISLVPCIRFLW